MKRTKEDIQKIINESKTYKEAASNMGIRFITLKRWVIKYDIDVSNFDQYKRQKQWVLKVCPSCNIEFKVRSTKYGKRQITCSKSCANKWFNSTSHNLSQKTVRCKICNKEKQTVQCHRNDWVCINCKKEHKYGSYKPKVDLEQCFIKSPNVKISTIRRVLAFQGRYNSCERCNISQWNNEPITLELHHINGDHYDNTYDNLQILCPNCHSQTKNFRNKHQDVSTKLNNKVSDDQIIKIISEGETIIHKILIKLGLSSSGGNYVRIKKIIGLYNQSKDFNVCVG